MELSTSAQGRKAAAKRKQSRSNGHRPLTRTCRSALILMPHPIHSLAPVHTQCVEKSDCSRSDFNNHTLSRILNLCLRLPPAGIELHAGSCAVIILAITTRIVIGNDPTMVLYKTCDVNRLSSHVCCCSSMF
jgi:hypothetical protein